MKLELKLSNNWLEATWYTEENEAKTQVHCEYFSGHPEHIAMLRARITEYDVDTTAADEATISELIASYVPHTQSELDAIETANKISEAKAYLSSTDFKMSVDYYATLTLEQQAELTTKRAEAREFLKGQGL